jgi:hypothetical protein
MLHISPTNLHLQTAKRISTPQQSKSAIQNSQSFEKHWKNFQEKVRKMGHYQKKDKIERATVLGRRRRDDKKSGIKITALRFQTVGRH